MSLPGWSFDLWLGYQLNLHVDLGYTIEISIRLRVTIAVRVGFQDFSLDLIGGSIRGYKIRIFSEGPNYDEF